MTEVEKRMRAFIALYCCPKFDKNSNTIYGSIDNIFYNGIEEFKLKNYNGISRKNHWSICLYNSGVNDPLYKIKIFRKISGCIKKHFKLEKRLLPLPFLYKIFNNKKEVLAVWNIGYSEIQVETRENGNINVFISTYNYGYKTYIENIPHSKFIKCLQEFYKHD